MLNVHVYSILCIYSTKNWLSSPWACTVGTYSTVLLWQLTRMPLSISSLHTYTIQYPPVSPLLLYSESFSSQSTSNNTVYSTVTVILWSSIYHSQYTLYRTKLLAKSFSLYLVNLSLRTVTIWTLYRYSSHFINLISIKYRVFCISMGTKRHLVVSGTVQVYIFPS